MRLGRYLLFGSSDFLFRLEIFRPEMFLFHKMRNVFYKIRDVEREMAKLIK